MEFSNEQLAVYFSGNYKNSGYDESVEKAESLRIHANGLVPEKLIKTRRPHESEMVSEYRFQIYEAITKPTFNKVLNSLAKIRRSSEWSIRFENEVPVRIPANETLQNYIETRFPDHTSITNWAFSSLLREYTIDANAWVAVIPEETEVKENQYQRPRPMIFSSAQVVEYGDDFLIALSGEKSTYINPNSKIEEEGDIYYVITDTYYQRWEQTNSDRSFGLKWESAHTIGQLPAFRMKGVAVSNNSKHMVQETRLAPMLPGLNEAAREYSDLQAEVVQHIHSEKWEIGQRECVACNGRAFYTSPDGFQLPCETCHGVGYEPRGPYTTFMIDPKMAGESNGPIPPMGYVQKDVAIVEVQDKRVSGHLFNALSAVNMEFLTQSPLAESGISKAYDTDETNNFVHAVAEDLVAMIDSVVYYITEIRYGVVIASKDERVKLIPIINVPDRFDLFSAKMIEEELASAKTSNVSPVILNALEIEYANKKFSNDPKTRALVQLTFKLDPLANVSEENKVLMLQNGGVTKESYVVSCNVQAFISRAIDEKGFEFLAMKLPEQKDIIQGYAEEQITANSAARQIMSTVTAQ